MPGSCKLKVGSEYISLFLRVTVRVSEVLMYSWVNGYFLHTITIVSGQKTFHSYSVFVIVLRL